MESLDPWVFTRDSQSASRRSAPEPGRQIEWSITQKKTTAGTTLSNARNIIPMLERELAKIFETSDVSDESRRSIW